jgi:hypothetical protein
LDVPHQLPALWLGQLRPNRHSLSNDSIRQHPENRAWSGALNLGNAEAWSLLAALPGITVALSAVLSKEDAARSNGVQIVLQRILAVPGFIRRLL